MRDGNLARFTGVFELVMAPANIVNEPAVLLKDSDDFGALHVCMIHID